jgi:S-DNA-T family DNA segregation ATPase FtsK/SpoIIIE
VPLVGRNLEALADFLAKDLEQRLDLQSARRSQIGFDRSSVPQQRRLVLVCDKFDPVSESSKSQLFLKLLEHAGPVLGLTIVCLATHENEEPSRVDLRVRVASNGLLTMEGKRSLLPVQVQHASADLLSVRHASLIGRAVAPLTLSNETDQVLAQTVSLPELLLGADLMTADISGGWAKPDEERVLRVPIGNDGEGETVFLDLKESAQSGMGPHGLIVGATGSGKSELLRTLVTGLALTHSPELLSFVLVDFKGGATFAQLTELPHVAGLITNLADDLAMVDRVQAALAGEQQRRHKLLRQAGNVDSLRDYQLRRAAGATDTTGQPLDPLPYLLIIVDEFGELLSRRPEFVDLFVQIGRVGRSLGMHLLLATQRLEEGRLRGLESHLSYRICLRTFSATESRTVIGTPDAYRLPPIPGSAYLKVDESIYQRLRVAHVSAPYLSQEQRQAAEQARPTTIAPYGFRRPPTPDEEAAPATGERPVLAGPSQMQVIIERLKWIGQATHQVWLPPLPGAVSLDTLLGPVGVVPGRGLIARHLPQTGQLRVPVGVIDLPLQQEQRPLLLDFSGLGGHLAVVGAPQAGKSTLLRTIMMSAMLTHSPHETQFYCIDFGGGGLHALQTAPHVGTVAGRTDPPLVRRMLAEVHAIIGERERLFRDAGIDSIGEFRGRRSAGRLPAGMREADVFLVIDNWLALKSEFDEAEQVVTEIAARGLGTGVHVILTLNRWLELRQALRESIGTRLELRLNDATESELGRALAAGVPARMPGRGLAPPGVYYHAALPRLDGRDTLAEMREAQEDALTKIAAGWNGPGAPPVRMLPDRITVSELARLPIEDGPGVPIGLAEPDLKPVRLSLTGSDPHLLVLGDAGSGKSSLLRTWCRAMAAAHSPFDIRLILVDYRRSLIAAVEDDYIGAYAGDAESAKVYTDQVVAKLRERVPPRTVTQRELRDRSWWEGPELYVVVDDYDLVGGGQSAPLTALAEFLAQAREVGLHLVLARRTGGVTRAFMTDPLMQRLREVSGSGVLLSGDPREGLLIGEHRGVPRPPGRGLLVRRSSPSTLLHIAVEDDESVVEPDDNAESSQARP